LISAPVVKTNAHSIVITPNRIMRVTATIMIMAGFGYLFFSNFPFNFGQLEVSSYKTVNYSFALLGLIYGCVGLFLLFRVDRIRWTPLSSMLEVYHGSIFYARRYYLPLDKIKPELVLSRHKELFKIVHRRSRCALLLRHNEHEEPIRIAVSSDKLYLLPALGKLTTFILDHTAVDNSSAIDQTVARVPLENGHMMRTGIGPLSRTAPIFKGFKPDFSAENQTVFYKGVFERLFWWAMTGIGGGMLLINIPVYLRESILPYEAVMLGAFCILLIIVGALGLYPGYDIQKIIADKDRKTILLKYGIRDFKRLRPQVMKISFDKIAAVQICAAHFDEWFTIYELNLILVSANGRRINISSYTRLNSVRRDAENFARFLRKPLLDNSML